MNHNWDYYPQILIITNEIIAIINGLLRGLQSWRHGPEITIQGDAKEKTQELLLILDL
ncbi:MAG: hypothetical protein ACI8T1_003535 [Verrucomicrobiales bacterium]|jgi:hypothetical protein